MAQDDFVTRVLTDLRSELSGGGQPAEEVLNSLLARLKDAPPETAVQFALAGLSLIEEDRTWLGYVLNQAAGGVLRRKLTFTEDQVVELIERVSQRHRDFPFKGVLKAAESLTMTPRIAEALRRLRPCITEYLGGGEMRDLHARIDNLLNGPAPDLSLDVQGSWSGIVFKEISESPLRAAWEAVFSHTGELKSSEASKKWLAAARLLVDAIGRDVFLEAAARWLALGPSPDRPGVQISSGEAEYQKGFLWFLAGENDARLPGLIADFAAAALKKITALGAVSQKVGNACVNVLAELPGFASVAQLSRLAQTIKYDTAQRLIEEALTRAAEKAGVSREQIEEMSASACGLGPDGTRSESFGDYSVRISIEETVSAALGWSDPQGKALKSIPACVKRTHAEQWKDLQRSVKEMEKMLSAHRSRIERLLATQRALSMETLRNCYLNHPLLADMCRRLIWQFESGLGIWYDGRVRDGAGQEIDLGAQKSARLWHPVSSEMSDVFHWRCWIEDHGIRQPFKQAHREVYLITAAERETGDYSNRFAAHILRQHQFAALCGQRGWDFRLMGQWDSHNTPTLELPQLGLRVQYEVDFPANESELSGHFIYLLIRTGAIRFLGGDGRPLKLESISPVVFSEAMRDVDLFTGVASIGCDPAWGQGGAAPFQQYWDGFTFGALTEMANNRKSVLERLIPRLAIRDRCRLEGRFLMVRGDRATYRIHLGSGAVLMEPGSRCVCIVEGAATKAMPRSLPLPFEGDQKLSLILSKAFLLAGDRKIKEESIRLQLPPLPD